MSLLALERLDGARLHTPEAATLKARTAAIVRTPTKAFQQAVSKDPALLAFPCRLPLTGGMRLHHGGVLVGGVGSSGGEPDDDVAVCRAGDRGAGSKVGDTERGRCRGDASVAATSALPTCRPDAPETSRPTSGARR